MPILFIGSGLVLVITGLNGDAGQLWNLIAQDFQGPSNFIYWMLSIIFLGLLGYVKGLEKFSRLFLVLVIIVLLLDNGGFFSKFQTFVSSQSSTAGG